MEKFVVTGGSGFIGSNLVKFLLNKNYFVINIDKLSYSANPYNLKEISKNKNYRFFKQDINNKYQVLKILNRFKPIGIFNLAAETHVDRSIDYPNNFIKANILGVYNLLETLKKYLKKKRRKIKLVNISTEEVYGDIEMGKRLHEKAPYQKNSNNYLFSFEIILQAAFFNLKYGEISISSSYEGYHRSCSYSDGFIYLLGNIKTIILFFLSKFNFYKYKTFK